MQLTDFQKRLCHHLQGDLPVCSRPFARLAEQLESSEEILWEQIQQLCHEGVIRRLQPILNYRALGYVSTLVTAHVPQLCLAQVIRAVNTLPGVSHNYLRDHHMNLWFTLQALSHERIRMQCDDLSEQCHIEFYNLPAKRMFKLDVRFDMQPPPSSSEIPTSPISLVSSVPMTDQERLVLCHIQDQWHLCVKPFHALGILEMDISEVLETIQGLKHKGIIRRIGAVLDQYKLGLTANVLCVIQVSDDIITHLAADLVKSPFVSHCYERTTFSGWPYNLYVMIHASSMDEIHSLVQVNTQAHPVDSYILLPTVRELKKQPIRFSLESSSNI